MRVLYLTHRLPYAPNRGDRIRAYYTLRALKGQADVDLVSLVHDSEERGHCDDLWDLAETIHVATVPRFRNMVAGVFSLPTRTPLTHALLDSPRLPAALER